MSFGLMESFSTRPNRERRRVEKKPWYRGKLTDGKREE